jgi:hypothetical protein
MIKSGRVFKGVSFLEAFNISTRRTRIMIAESRFLSPCVSKFSPRMSLART